MATLGRALPALVIGLALACLGGCGGMRRYVATDWTVWAGQEPVFADGDVDLQAAIASARHDIPCEHVTVLVPGHRDFVLEGCGARVTYLMVYPYATLVGRVAVK